MKKQLKLILYLLSTALVWFGCEPNFDPEKCLGEDAFLVETFYNEELLQFPCAILPEDESYGARNFIITTQDEFDETFICNDGFPTIDFNQYFVLAGRFRYRDDASLQSQSVILCENKLVYNVEIKKSILNSITNVFYYQVVDREYLNKDIIFNVN